MNSVQSSFINLKPGGAITWSVRIQIKPIVIATARKIIRLVKSTRRSGNTFIETDVFVDMAASLPIY